MVAARKLEPQKQLIEVVLLHKLEGTYPDVAISSNVDFEGLVQPDIEAGEKPFFITLPLGHVGQLSRNQRRYVGDVAVQAIYDAIWNHSITGQLGHTAEERRGWEFKIPVLKWVGALVDEDGVVWGKAYVNRTKDGMDMREYYRTQGKTNATVGTSLEGMGYQEWNADLELWDILELEVHRIDAVSPEGVGILKAGSMPPKITSETNTAIQEAEPGEIAVGDYVAWEDRNGSLVRGQVNTVWTDGEHEVPYSDSPPLPATEDNPLARMDTFRPNYEERGWIRTDWQQVQYVRDLTKIEALPESIDQEEEDIVTEKSKRGAATAEGQEPDVDVRIVEIQEQWQEEVRELNRQIVTLQANERTLARLREMLGVKEGQDPVLALQAMQSTLDSQQRENADLLETAIKQEVSTHVKVAWAQGVVEQHVRAKNPLTRAEVVTFTAEVLSDPHIAVIVKNAVQQSMGPNVQTPKGNVGELGQPGNAADIFIIVPGMEG